MRATGRARKLSALAIVVHDNAPCLRLHVSIRISPIQLVADGRDALAIVFQISLRSAGDSKYFAIDLTNQLMSGRVELIFQERPLTPGERDMGTRWQMAYGATRHAGLQDLDAITGYWFDVRMP